MATYEAAGSANDAASVDAADAGDAAESGPPSITVFPVPTMSSHPNGITAGPDGNLWFTDSSGNTVGRVSR